MTRLFGKSDEQKRTELQTKDEIAGLMHTNERLEREIAGLMHTNESLEHEIAGLMHTNESLTKENKRLTKTNEHLTRQLNKILDDWTKEEEKLKASGVTRLTDLQFAMKLNKDSTWYEVLHVSSSATQKEIRSSFLTERSKWTAKKSKKPLEKQPNSVEQEAVDLIDNAYAVLSNEKLRYNYDEIEKTNPKQNPERNQQTGPPSRPSLRDHWPLTASS